MQTCWSLDKFCPTGCSTCLVEAADLSDWLLWRHKACPAHTQLIMSWHKYECYLLNCRSCVSRKCKPLHHSRLPLLQGKESWNKGKRLDQAICDKMSAAKQGHTVPRSVCAKMSRSHAGLRPSQVCTNNLLPATLCQACI